MKAFKNIAKVGVVAVSLIFAACSSDDNGGGGGGTPSGTYIKAKVSGSQFQTLEIQGQSFAIATKTGTGSGTLISISGGADMQGEKSMVISLIGIEGTGTYNITPDSDSVLAYVMNSTQTSYDTSNCAGATGTVNITKYTDTQIEGTFTFTGKDDENCTDTKEVTQGSFRGNYVN